MHHIYLIHYTQSLKVILQIYFWCTWRFDPSHKLRCEVFQLGYHTGTQILEHLRSGVFKVVQHTLMVLLLPIIPTNGVSKNPGTNKSDREFRCECTINRHSIYQYKIQIKLERSGHNSPHFLSIQSHKRATVFLNIFFKLFIDT